MYFHVVISKDFHWDPEKDFVVLKSAALLGSWDGSIAMFPRYNLLLLFVCSKTMFFFILHGKSVRLNLDVIKYSYFCQYRNYISFYRIIRLFVICMSPSLTITFCLIGLLEIRDILLKDILKFPRKDFMSVYPTNMQFTSTVKTSSFMRPSTRKRKMTTSTDACRSNKGF